MAANRELSITVEELRAAFDRLFSAIEAQHGTTFARTDAWYWEVSLGEAFDVTSKPELTLGTLEDDITETLEMIKRPAEEGIFLWHDLNHAVGVLRVIAAMDLPDPPPGL